jgi:hypothetical protein
MLKESARTVTFAISANLELSALMASRWILIPEVHPPPPPTEIQLGFWLRLKRHYLWSYVENLGRNQQKETNRGPAGCVVFHT